VGGRPRRQRHRHLPMIVIFFLGQRYFVEGIATTGRKG
jgi:ABC-type maltose transport system permease subunit